MNGSMNQSIATILFLLLGAIPAIAADDALLNQHDIAQQEAERSVRDYHALTQSETPDEAAVSKAHQAASEHLKRSIELELRLRQQRIESAKKRLDAVAKRLAESRKNIERLVEDSLTEKLASLQAPPAAVFAEPMDAINFMEEKVGEGKFREMVRTVLTDEAVDDFAGTLMLSSAFGSAIRKMADVSSDVVVDVDDLELANKMEKLLNQHREPNPDAKNLAAFRKVTGQFVNGTQASIASTGPIDMDDFRAATKMIKDPREFVVDFLEMLHRHSGEVLLMRSPDGSRINWSVTIDGDTAGAISTKHVDQSNAPKLRLAKQNGSWMISSLLTDEMLKQCLRGPVANLSTPAPPTSISSSPLAPPIAQPQPVSPYAPPPVGMPVAADSPWQGYPHASPRYPAPNSYAPAAIAPPSGLPASAANSPPLYSGQTITSWLNSLQMHTYGQGDNPEAIKAVKALASHSSSDIHIRGAMAQWFAQIKNELNTDYRKRQAGLIVFVGQQRHQELAMDYLFQIATGHQEYSRKVALEMFEDNYYLRDAITNWETWNSETASLLAERIRDGDSNERMFALIFPMIYSSDLEKEQSSEFEAWFLKQRNLIEPALLLALKDENEFVRSVAMQQLLSITPMSESVASELMETLKTEENADMLGGLLSALAAELPDSEELHETILQWAKSEDVKKHSAVFSMWSSDQQRCKRSRNIAEMAEVLSDPDWGRKTQLEWYTSETVEGERPLREHVIALLGEYRAHAADAIPSLNKELERSDASSKAIVQRSIDRIQGYSRSFPIKQLQGEWTLLLESAPAGGVSELAFPLDPTKNNRVKVIIRGSDVLSSDRVIANLSGDMMRQGNQVKLVSTVGSKVGHYVGQFSFPSTDPFAAPAVDGEVSLSLARVFPHPGPPVTIGGKALQNSTSQKYRLVPVR